MQEKLEKTFYIEAELLYLENSTQSEGFARKKTLSCALIYKNY